MNQVLRIMTSIANVICLIQARILTFIHRKKPPSIPPITNTLYTLSATTLAKKIRRREITSYEVVKAYVERIKTVNPYLNAVIEDRFEAALNEARICDEQLRVGKFDVETLEKEKPLFGVPLTVKECCSLKDLSFTSCTLARKGVKATEDGIVVGELRNAGAIPLCVTNTPEMCASYDSTNRMFGRTCNPYDTRYTVGGSTGGEGALIGAGASLIGIGSDLAGSVRIPAHLNGVFGHKPTAGITSNKGHFPSTDDETFNKFLVTGPLTRYAEDLSLVLRLLTSKCNRDLQLDVPVDLKHLKVYYRQSTEKTFGLLPIAPEIEQCVLKAADYFSQSGIHTEMLPIEWPKEMLEIGMTSFIAVRNTPPLLFDAKNPELRKSALVEMVKAVLGKSHHSKTTIFLAMMMDTQFPYTDVEISQYVQKREIIREEMLNLLGKDGVLIYPTFRIPATFSLSMVLELWNSAPYPVLANILGFPSTHVPMGLNRDGLPIGVQVIAAPYQDRLCFAVAKELEKAFGGWIPPSISINS